MERQVVIRLLILLAMAGLSTAATINVPADQPTIQDAINAASDNDEVVVADSPVGGYTGTGFYNIDFKGKAITVRSANGPETCIIDCQSNDRGFIFQSGEEADSVLEGFTITGGQAIYGGAIECDSSSPTISNCIITGNTADNSGGGVDLFMSSAVITDCNISNNTAVRGGGVNCDTDYGTAPNISFCEITGNNSTSYGGGIQCYDSSAIIKNCLIANNTANGPGGAVYLYRISGAEISNCTIVNNTGSGGFGGIYRNDDSVTPAIIINSILWNNGDDLYNLAGMSSHCCIEDNDIGLNNIPYDPIFRSGPLGDYYLSQTAAGQLNDSPCVDAGSGSAAALGLAGSTTRTDNGADANEVDMGYHYPDSGSVVTYQLTTAVDVPPNDNGTITPDLPGPGSPYVQFAEVALSADPCDGFKIKSWQDTDDDGSNDVNNIVTMNSDKNVVVAFEPLAMYTLTTEVIGGHGDIEPHREKSYYEGTVVDLTADPEDGYRVQAWSSNTDNGPSWNTNTNTVTMTSNKHVTVTFEPDTHHILRVGAVQDYTTIQSAIYAANNGDTVIIYPGTYPGTTFAITKNITITGLNPNDPNEVIIDLVPTEIGFALFGDGGSCTLNGVTVINARRRYTNAHDGVDSGDPGYDGGTIFGGAVLVYGDHTISNCIIRDCLLTGNRGGDGADGDPNGFPPSDPNDANSIIYWPDGGDGGDGGSAYGAGIYVDSGNVLIKNCVIDNCTVIGGEGGDGATGVDADMLTYPTSPGLQLQAGRGGDAGDAGQSYGGGVYTAAGSNVTFDNCVIRDCNAIGGEGGDGGNAGAMDNGLGYNRGGFGGMVDPWNDPNSVPRLHTSNGGGVFCDGQAAFINCKIINNEARGSHTGQGGLPSAGIQAQPRANYNLPSFGAGVYCAWITNTTFTGCSFEGNRTLFDVNNSRFSNDPDYEPKDYTGAENLGYGGGICFDSFFGGFATAEVNDCNFIDNFAFDGGGLYAVATDLTIRDSSFIDNLSHIGGGVLAVDSRAAITNCTVRGNTASSAFVGQDDPNYQPADPNRVIFGYGGGLQLDMTETLVFGCEITGNLAASSGGGLYLGGGTPSVTNFTDDVELTSCLIKDNIAGAEGGGVASSWFAKPKISNCTIVGNAGSSYGGGVIGSYGSYTEIVDSIIWENFGINGTQLAVRTGDIGYPIPSTIDISYSDIYIPADTNEVSRFIDANGIPVIRDGFDTNSLAANDDGSTGLVDIGFNINYFGSTNSRLYVNNNGNVTFDAPLRQFTPFGLSKPLGTPIIAPFFADVDTRGEVEDANNLTKYGTGTIDGHRAFGVTWLEVGYFSSHTDLLNSFQMILIDRSDLGAGNFDIEFNYENIDWETGDASGGEDGLDGNSVAVGFSNGTGNPGTYYEFEGSMVNGALLDNNFETGLIHNSRSCTVDGRYLFSVRNGFLTVLYEGGGITPIYEDASGPSTIIGWDPDTNSWDPNSHNITSDPCFAEGQLGSYYLSQIAAGQLVDSLCVDAGDPESEFNTTSLTTRIDHIADSGRVDMGYHYNAGIPVSQNQLTIEVIDDGWGTNGRLIAEGWGDDAFVIEAPDTRIVNRGRTVNLRALPDPGYRVRMWVNTNDDASGEPNNTATVDVDKTVSVQFETILPSLTTYVIGDGTISPAGRHIYDPNTVVHLTATPNYPTYAIIWTGTDDDYSTLADNTVTLYNEHKEVYVEFYEPNLIEVAGDWTDIEFAIASAHDRDIVRIMPGTYDAIHSGEYGGWIVIDDKAITLTSSNYDDPCTVAETVIKGRLLIINSGKDTIINGLTFQMHEDTQYYIGGRGCDGLESPPCENLHVDGMNGYSMAGGGIRLFQYGSDWWGWGSEAMTASSPTIRNCVFRGLWIRGGNGGNGAYDTDSGAGDGGWGGWAHGGAVAIGEGSTPLFENCTFIDCNVQGGDGGQALASEHAGYGGSWGNNLDPHWFYGPYQEYWKYGGYGGAVYCGVDSSPRFIDCRFINNKAFSGCSGRGAFPGHSMKIDNFGGAVYGAAGSKPVFTGCSFIGNEADVNGPEFHHDDDQSPTVNADPYLSYGGAVAFEDSASPVFEDCLFNGNLATIGGAMWWNHSDPTIGDCSFVDNSAFHGAGVLFVGGTTKIARSVFRGNKADMPGAQGGAITSLSANTLIIDCDIRNNQSSGSGGGIYVSSKNVDGSDVGDGGGETVLIKNSLIANNSARRDGGGISANWYSDPNIVNCTITDNRTIGTGLENNYGGGVYCSYGNYTNIINSIIWDNYSFKGSQIALGRGNEYDPRPSMVNVAYSNIGPSYDANEGVFDPDADYYIYSTLDTTGHQYSGSYGVDGYVGSDGNDRIIYYSFDATGNPYAYIFKVTIPQGSDPHMHPDSLETPGPVAPRTFTFERSFELGSNFTGGAHLRGAEFYVDAKNDVIYVGASEDGILKYTFDSNEDNYVYNSTIAPAPNNVSTESLAYDPDNHIWYAGPRDFNSTLWKVLKYDGSQGPLGTWETAFTYTPVTGGSYHDGMEFVNGYLFLADYMGDYVQQFTPDGQLVNIFYHTALAHELEGMGWGALYHFWVGSRINIITEFGGGALQTLTKRTAPSINVEPDCTLIGWDADTNSWDPLSHNITSDPCFVDGPDGSYYLSQTAAGQTTNSNCVDTGSADADSLGMYKHTTRTDKEIDSNIVDMGYHYLRWGDFFGDFDFDGDVDMFDYGIFLGFWLSDDCQFPDWCRGADLNRDGVVNFIDDSMINENYGKTEQTPPEPNPMTWKQIPVSAVGQSWVTMTATKAVDNYSGTNVEYYFQRTDTNGNPDGSFRDWGSDRTYTDTGVVMNTEYGYRVRARDAKGNQTAWSETRYIVAGEDSEPPITDPCAVNPYKSTWETLPHATSLSSIEMVATTATDQSGVQYYFDCTSGNGNDSEWQNSPIYEDTGLDPNTRYTYRVQARDQFDNRGDWSDSASVTTPLPVPMPVIVDCYQMEYLDGYWHHIIVASATSEDPNYYQFICTNAPTFNSEWVLRDGVDESFPHPVGGCPDATITHDGDGITYDIAVSSGTKHLYQWKVCTTNDPNVGGELCSEPQTALPR